MILAIFQGEVAHDLREVTAIRIHSSFLIEIMVVQSSQLPLNLVYLSSSDERSRGFVASELWICWFCIIEWGWLIRYCEDSQHGIVESGTVNLQTLSQIFFKTLDETVFGERSETGGVLRQILCCCAKSKEVSIPSMIALWT
jgi:hypothetical protein